MSKDLCDGLELAGGLEEMQHLDPLSHEKSAHGFGEDVVQELKKSSESAEEVQVLKKSAEEEKEEEKINLIKSAHSSSEEDAEKKAKPHKPSEQPNLKSEILEPIQDSLSRQRQKSIPIIPLHQTQNLL
jgi:hypothetical protein